MPEDTIFELDDYKFTFRSTKDPGKLDLYYLKNGDASKPLKVEKDQSLTPDDGSGDNSDSSDSSPTVRRAETRRVGETGRPLPQAEARQLLRQAEIRGAVRPAVRLRRDIFSARLIQHPKSQPQRTITN